MSEGSMEKCELCGEEMTAKHVRVLGNGTRCCPYCEMATRSNRLWRKSKPVILWLAVVLVFVAICIVGYKKYIAD